MTFQNWHDYYITIIPYISSDITYYIFTCHQRERDQCRSAMEKKTKTHKWTLMVDSGDPTIQDKEKNVKRQWWRREWRGGSICYFLVLYAILLPPHFTLFFVCVWILWGHLYFLRMRPSTYILSPNYWYIILFYNMTDSLLISSQTEWCSI